MKRLRPSIVALLVGLLPFAVPVRAEAPTYDPIELVRTLRTVQDQIVHGSRSAHAAHRKLIVNIADQLLKVQPEQWREPRNLRAGILFALSGGDPRVARHILGLGNLPPDEDRLLRGALAHAEGRTPEAIELMAGINPKSLDLTIGGHVALIQATMLAKDEPNRAIPHFEMARLLAPGTLVEEAALRREILMLSSMGEFGRFEALAARYMRRYRNSVYGYNFRRQLAVEIAGMKSWDKPERLARLDTMLEVLSAAEQQDVYLTMAETGILKGHVQLTKFAAQQASTLSADKPAASPRSHVYEAAALIVTEDFESGLAKLKGVERGKLAAKDAELLDAALQMAKQIRHVPEAGETAPAEDTTARARDLATVGVRSIKSAQAAMTKVDAMMSAKSK